MQRLGELLLMLSGTAVLGAYLYLPPPPDDAADLAEVTRISIAPYHKAQTDDRAVRGFLPASPGVTDIVKIDNSAAATDRRTTPDVWTTIVRPHRSETAVLRSAKPGDAATRYELARDLQRELKRAGCYGGEITGVWSPATKQAMSAFLDRANATLPIKAPDYILLSLVQNHNEIACTATCPSGQLMNEGGRCVPDAVVAQAAKRSKQIANARPSVTVHAPEQLPWLDSNGRSLVAAAPATERRQPPPGMMSIGGPVAAAPASANSAPVAGASGSVADPDASKIAAVTPDDELTDDANAAAIADPDALPGVRPERRYRAKRSREWNERPRRYGSAGRHHRRGDPHPGSARYNLVQALGGIY
jgi:hypothetical protein